MCNSVNFEGQEYWTPGQLASLVGGEDRLVWAETNPFRNLPPDSHWRDLDLCLCPVELEETLRKAELDWRRGDDPMEYFVFRRD